MRQRRNEIGIVCSTFFVNKMSLLFSTERFLLFFFVCLSMCPRTRRKLNFMCTDGSSRSSLSMWWVGRWYDVIGWRHSKHKQDAFWAKFFAGLDGCFPLLLFLVIELTMWNRFFSILWKEIATSKEMFGVYITINSLYVDMSLLVVVNRHNVCLVSLACLIVENFN